MGQGQSREAREKPSFNGVRMTQALGNRLGLTESNTSIILEESVSDLMRSKDPEIRAAVSLSSRVDKDVKKATEQLIAKNKILSKALQTSKHVNDLLLAREEEEMEKIDKLSRDILEKEAVKYDLDVEHEEKAPCEAYEERVLRCYLEHAGDPFKCRSVVEEYAECGQRVTVVE